MRKSDVKLIAIIVLAVLVVVEGIGIIFVGRSNKGDNVINVSLNMSLDGAGDEVGEAVSTVLTDALSGVKNGSIPAGTIGNAVKGVVYSDFVVNAVTSIAMPLLYQTLVDLGMLDFATNMDLYATGPLFATKLEGKTYTCVDKDGERKPLVDVLNAVGEDWTYMDEKVAWKDEDGKQVTTTLWNSIQWGVKDEATFYAAMNDVGEALRGVLEVTMQGKERVVNVNVPEVLVGKDVLPINLDAAVVYNETGKGGWEAGLIPLFNELGLVEGEYPSVEEFNAYESCADIWKAIFGSILNLVDKIEKDPVNGLTSMLVGFADAVDSGKFKGWFETLRLDADFHELATIAMGFNDGLLVNLGDVLLSVVEQTGIKVTGNFNELLDSLPSAIFKKSVNLPDMSVDGLRACATEKTLPNGNKAYTADANKTVNFLVNYICDDEVIKVLVDALGLTGTPEGDRIISGATKSEEGLRELASAVVSVILGKIKPKA